MIHCAPVVSAALETRARRNDAVVLSGCPHLIARCSYHVRGTPREDPVYAGFELELVGAERYTVRPLDERLSIAASMNEDELRYLQKMQSFMGDGMYETRINDLQIRIKARLPQAKHQAKEKQRAASHGGKFCQNPFESVRRLQAPTPASA